MKPSKTGRINSYKMLKAIKDWLKDNEVKVVDNPDWDKPKSGQTGLSGTYGNHQGRISGN